MAAHSGTTGNGFCFTVIERTQRPGVNIVAFPAIQGTDKDMVGTQAGGVNPIMAVFTWLRSCVAVIEQLLGRNPETNRGMATVTRGCGLDVIQRFTNGKDTIVTLLALCR